MQPASCRYFRWKCGLSATVWRHVLYPTDQKECVPTFQLIQCIRPVVPAGECADLPVALPPNAAFRPAGKFPAVILCLPLWIPAANYGRQCMTVLLRSTQDIHKRAERTAWFWTIRQLVLDARIRVTFGGRSQHDRMENGMVCGRAHIIGRQEIPRKA